MALCLARERKAACVYLTDDDIAQMNPWDELASVGREQVDAARGLIFSDGFESGGLGAWTR
ncbi:MAG: hypothetical protein AAGD06_18545 [Acidobacteriota bacterium]